MRWWWTLFALMSLGCGDEGSSNETGGAGGSAGSAPAGAFGTMGGAGATQNGGRGAGAGRGGTSGAGATGGTRMEPGLGSEGWEQVHCQVHHAECASVTTDDRCTGLLMDDDGVVYSFVYPHGSSEAPREPIPWRDADSYAAKPDAISDAERKAYGPGTPVCIDAEHESPDDVCAKLCGDDRHEDTADASSFPPIPGGDEPYCVAFPVVGEGGTTIEPAPDDEFCY